MKKMLCACAVLMMAFTTVTALAATDITGTWVGDLTNESGTYPISFIFKQDGAKLTGTVQPPDGDPLVMSDCKIDGDKISFKVTYNGTVITNEGTITGDEIKLAMKSDQGDPSGGGMTLKRSDAAKTPPVVAADVTGTWSGEVKNPDGNGFKISYTFKQSGAKLTGTALTPQGDPIAITDGKVDGAKISFSVNVNGTIIEHEGTVHDDEIKLSAHSDQGPAGDVTLKRSDAAKPAPAN